LASRRFQGASRGNCLIKTQLSYHFLLFLSSICY
jgi:hypothetical protein